MKPIRALAIVAIALSVIVIGCPPSPAPPGPDADASPAPPSDAPIPAIDAPPVSADVQAACAVLAAAGCREGAPQCAGALQTALNARDSAKVTPESVACVGKARADVAAIRACGSQWCP